MSETEEWRPGSFTRNFSWGDESAGLSQLHEIIRIGFRGELNDVPHGEFRARAAHLGRPDYIAINIVLFNKIVNGVDVLPADELVFQALTDHHSPRFERLAIFAFIFSYAGTRKSATNLNYLYSLGRLSEFSEPKVERWWVDALFFALDRVIEDRKLSGFDTAISQYASLLDRAGFASAAGQFSLDRQLATRHLCAPRPEQADANVRIGLRITGIPKGRCGALPTRASQTRRCASSRLVLMPSMWRKPQNAPWLDPADAVLGAKSILRQSFARAAVWPSAPIADTNRQCYL